MSAKKYKMKRKKEKYDIVVCGGGLAGVCAAISAARQGVNTCIIQDRPVFGGNSSSEIKVKPLGPDRFHAFARSTGIISELLIEERANNHVKYMGDNGFNNSIWDMVLYNAVVNTPNLSFHLNSSVISVINRNENSIKAVLARIANAETELEIEGKLFIDCTGDGIVAAMAGCEWRLGEEARSEFEEFLAPEKATDNTMGNSIHFTAKDVGRPVSYTPPDWAVEFDDPDYFYKSGRGVYNCEAGFWWLEIGIPWHTIYDNEDIRHELTRYTLGVWDWIKNKDPYLKDKAKNYDLDWIGQVPGKRESRRIMGLYLMNDNDIREKKYFSDEIAYGGFYLDIHTIGGLLAETSEPVNAAGNKDIPREKSKAAQDTYIEPYGIPLKILISRDIKNLMMAGRNVSVTHRALGSIRVMTTTALLGQAVGTTAAYSVKDNVPIHDTLEKSIFKIQQTLLKDGCFLPNNKNEDPDDLARKAKVSANSTKLLNGIGPTSISSLNKYFDYLKSYPRSLEDKIGQWIAIGEEGVEKISVCLNNESSQVQLVNASLIAVRDIWDYDCSSQKKSLVETDLTVKPGKQQWIEWEVNLDKSNGLFPGQYIRLDLGPNKDLSWQTAGTVLPGHTAAYEFAKGRMRKLDKGITMSFKISPAQNVFYPDNVLSGVTRPYQFTNLWLSDPRVPLPVWFKLVWDEYQEIETVQLTFSGNLNFPYGDCPPYYRDPQVAKNYSMFTRTDEGWKEIIKIEDNYQCLCRHKLPEKIKTDELKIVIYDTNGESNAGLYEIRCY